MFLKILCTMPLNTEGVCLMHLLYYNFYVTGGMEYMEVWL